MKRHVILAHGYKSGPEAAKITALARVAEALGCSTERPDFRDCDASSVAKSVDPRVKRLVQRMQACPEPPIVVGSSLGAFTAGLASEEAPCVGLFLMALPILLPETRQPFVMSHGLPAMLIHGTADDVCPDAGAMVAAGEYDVPLLLLPDGHRLSDHIPVIEDQFRLFLERLPA